MVPARDLVPALVLSIGLCSTALGCGGGGGGSAPAQAVAASTTGTNTGNGATSGSGTVGPVPLQPPAGTWLKGDFHVHSTWSGDALKLGDDVGTVIKCAERAGLDFTTISDHRTVDVLTDPKFLNAQTRLVLIPGEEWGGPGHAGAHGLTRAPLYLTQDETGGPAAATQRIQATIDDIHTMGGIFVLNHAIDDKNGWNWPVDRFDGLEVFNQPWAFRNTPDIVPADIQAWATSHGMVGQGTPQPPPEVFAALQRTGGGLNWQRVALYEAYLSSGHHISAMGGSDSHFLVLPGNPTTLVLAETPTMAGILDGVRRGRTMVARAADAPRLEFAADRDGDGVFETIIGDSIPLGMAVTFKIHLVGADGGKIDLVRNGQVVQHWAVTSNDFEVRFTDTPTAKTWYRVNSFEKIDMSVPYASVLRALVVGTSTLPGWINSLFSASFAGHVQDIIDQGGPAGVWLLVFGSRMGCTSTPVATRYPRLEFPKSVSQILNACVHDPDYCPAVLTSAIWVE